MTLEGGAPMPHGHRPHFGGHRPTTPIPAGGIPPTAEEVTEFNSGTNKKSLGEKLAGSKIVKATVGIVGGAAVLEGAHVVVPEIPDVPGIYSYIDSSTHRAIDAIQNYRDSLSPSKGAEFHPKASSGEITEANVIPLSAAESLDMSLKNSSEHGELAIPLPFKVENGMVISYEIGSKALQDPNYIKITGVPDNTIFYTPFDGDLSWVKFPGGDMAVWIKGLDLPWSKSDNPNQKPVLTFQGKNFSLSFSDVLPNAVTTENGQTVSSSIHVKAGQPIFTIGTQDKLNVFGEEFQVGISGYIPSPETRAVHAFISIINDSNKAVFISPNQQ